MDSWANPSNTHTPGGKARVALEDARQRIAKTLGLTSSSSSSYSRRPQILFTAGGTESNNLVLQGTPWAFLVTTATEHSSVYITAQYLATQRGCHVVFLPTDATGRINLSNLRNLLQQLLIRFAAPGLLSLMYVNNEIGVIHDIQGVGAMLRQLDPERRRAGLHMKESGFDISSLGKT